MKIDRLISIIMILSNRKRVSAKELAEKFEVSVKTIQRDIDAINMAGIPIVAYKGYDGGYEIMENYKINKSVVNEKEHSMVFNLLEGLGKVYEDKTIENLKEKFKCANSSMNLIEEGNIVFDFSSWGNADNTREKLNIISEALKLRKTIEFTYITFDGNSTKRELEPLKIIFKGLNFYICGFCRLRGDIRLFKLTRIKGLNRLDNDFVPRIVDINEFFKPREDNLITLKLKFNKSALNKLDDYFDAYVIEFNEKGDAIVEVEYPENNWIYSMLLSFGSDIEVIEPIHIREIIRKNAEKIIKLYK